MSIKLVAILGSVTPPGRLLNASRAMLDDARAAHQDLEAELKLVKAASALFEESEVISPKGSTRLSED